MADHLDGGGFESPDHDARVDITDHYVFLSPGDAARTVFVLNVNPLEEATNGFRSDAVYATLIDTDGDALPDLHFMYRFSPPDPSNGAQLATVTEGRGDTLIDEQSPGQGYPVTDPDILIAAAPVSFGKTPVVTPGPGGIRFFAGLRADPFFFDTQAWLNNFSFHNPGSNFFAGKNVYSIVLEVPNGMLGGNSPVGVWTRTEVPSANSPGQMVIADQMGHSLITSFYCASADQEPFNMTPPDRQRTALTQSGQTFLASFSATLQKWGRASGAADAVAKQLLPDILQYDHGDETRYPNGRKLQDDTADYELNRLTDGQKPTDYVPPHDNYLTVFPYVGTPY